MSTTNIATFNRIPLSHLPWVALVAIVAASLANLTVYVVTDALWGVAWG